MRRVVATSIKEYLPPHLKLLFTLFKEKKTGHRIALEAGDVWFQELLTHQESANDRFRLRPQPDDPAIMLMSGGTTGIPKAVVGSHRCMVQAGLQLRTWLQPPDGSRGRKSRSWRSRSFTSTPASAFRATRSPAGIPMALVPNPRDIDDLLKCIATVRPTLFSAVPALFIALLNHPKVKAGRWTSARSGPASPERRR